MPPLGFRARGWAPEPTPLDVAGHTEGLDGATRWPPPLYPTYTSRFQPGRAAEFLATRATKFFKNPLHVSH